MNDFLSQNFQKNLINNSNVVNDFLNLNLPVGNVLNKKLLKAMKYSLLGSGKKIRSYLLIETGKLILNFNNMLLTDKINHELILLGSAIEAIHTYSLIHDDLPSMDDSDFRRGKKSSHVKFGEATAILAGDALQSWAFELISRPDNISDVSKVSKIIYSLSKAIGCNGMAGGQQGDIDFTTKTSNKNDIFWIQQKKTGNLLECCVKLGGIIGDANDSQIIKLKKYANCLGIAFQIKDDLLDLNSDAKILGKPTRQDKSNEAPNFVNLYGEINSKKKLKEFIDEALEALKTFGKSANNLVLLAKYVRNRDF